MLIRYFAAAAAAAGTPEETVHVETSLTRVELQDLLLRLHPDAPPGEPGLAQVLPRCSWLVNGVAARDAQALIPPNATVDVLPPFAGG